MFKISFTSSLPFLFACLVFSICNDHQLFGVSRWGDPWWSFRSWRSNCL